MFDAIEDQALERDRLRKLLARVLDLSDERRSQRESELPQAWSERTRVATSIERLLIAVEEGHISPSDPGFATRMATNRAAPAAAVTRIDVLEAQLASECKQIGERTVDRAQL